MVAQFFFARSTITSPAAFELEMKAALLTILRSVRQRRAALGLP